MENDEVLMFRCRLVLDWIFRNPQIAFAFWEAVGDEWYDLTRETWYLLNHVKLG